MTERKNYKFKYQENILRSLKTKIYNIYSETIDQQSRRDHLENRLKGEVYDDENWKKLANHRRDFLRGFIDALEVQINTKIEWRVFYPELGLIKGSQVPAGKWNEINSDKSRYVWKSSGKHYTLSKEEKKELLYVN